MKRIGLIATVLGLVVLALAQGAQSSEAPRVLEFDTMAAVRGPYVGTANPIRGVPGGGLPWQIDRGEGGLRRDGRLEVRVEGLVLKEAAPVPPELQGTNPVANFRAIVSCESIVDGAAQTVNRTTRQFPATPDGDARIVATIEIPRPCFAPIVFVTSPTGAWFAVTGR
ncbi:MAG TPA: hypothetical protein VFZ75_04500 [Actinomycetota bacterium]|nr:hypothetical protein [Actinomycetota bacterium]